MQFLDFGNKWPGCESDAAVAPLGPVLVRQRELIADSIFMSREARLPSAVIG